MSEEKIPFGEGLMLVGGIEFIEEKSGARKAFLLSSYQSVPLETAIELLNNPTAFCIGENKRVGRA